MTGRARHIDGRQRQWLRNEWELCATAPGAVADPSQLGNAELAWPWTKIPNLAPVAAALRDAGQWSHEAPSRRFDAHDWWYGLKFDAPGAEHAFESVLGFDGLATQAEVWLNGELLLASGSMFIGYQLDVGRRLRAQGNELVMVFRSLDAQLAKRRPRPRWRAPMVENQQIRWWRTTLLGRTPGWSPPAQVVGPWQGVWLEYRDGTRVPSLKLSSRVEGDRGVVDIACTLVPPAGDAIRQATLEVEREGSLRTQLLDRDGDGPSFKGQLSLQKPDLWWPHTHGEPALYDARLRVVTRRGIEMLVGLGRIGFRSVTLDTRNGDFALKINGVPVFCRGACWMPIDPLALHAGADAYRDAIAQALEAGMNMLRVPGTNVYESEAFFDECDAQGMLVWQDFMFANLDYPQDDDAFATWVDLEARQQLERWQARPSLAVLCGNSEVEQQAAMWGAPRELWRSPLFDEVLAEHCREWAPQVPYWPSSAHGGSFPHQVDTGSTSYYGVGAYLRPLEDARRAAPRFASECLAFANVPPRSTIARMPGGEALRVHHPCWKARTPRDLGAGCDFDDHRDHYLEQLFGVSARQLRYVDHDRYLALSRVTSGEVMAATFAEWRRASSSCRGALILFLRDLWAGSGWGVVDDAGVPKACWHYLKRALQPVSLALTDEGLNGLVAHLINERAEPFEGSLEVSVWRDGEVSLARAAQAVRVEPRGAMEQPVAGLFDHLMDLSHAYRFGPLAHDAVVATLLDAEGQMRSQAFHFPGGLNLRRERDLGLTATVRLLDSGDAEVLLTTQRLAQSVHFDLSSAHVARDEFFHMAPNSGRRVLLKARKPGAGQPMGTVLALNTAAVATLRAAAAQGNAS